MHRASCGRNSLFSMLTSILLACMLFPAFLTAQHRSSVSLDGEWYFLPRLSDRGAGGRMKFETGDAIRSTWRRITVPSCWQREFEDLKYFEGVAWYSRDFTFDGDPDSVDARLVFEGVNYICRVWLNGVPLGDHEGGYTTFELPVRDALEKGNNTLAVRVDNRRHLLTVPGDVGWFNYGGIYRSVRLEVRPPVHVDDVYLRTLNIGNTGAEVLLQATVNDSNGRGRVARLSVEFAAADGRRAGGLEREVPLPGSGQFVTGRIGLPADLLRTWSPDDPHRYDVSVKLAVAGRTVDSTGLRFGVRTFRVDGDRLLLNGEPFYARGMCYLYDFPATGRTFDPETFATDLSNFRELGVNFLRNHFPFDPRMLEAFDSLGIMVWQDVPVYWVDEYDQKLVRTARQQAREMAVADRNRACMAVWSLGNENAFSPEERVALFGELGREIKRHVPDAVTSAALFAGAAHETAGLVDIISVNTYPGWYNFLGRDPIMWTADSSMLEDNLQNTRRNLTETIDRLPAAPFWISEVGAGATADMYLDQPRRLFGQPYQAYLERRQLEMVSTLPRISGILQFTYNDFHDPSRMEAPGQSGKNLKGCVTIDRERKESFNVIREFYRRWGR